MGKSFAWLVFMSLFISCLFTSTGCAGAIFGPTDGPTQKQKNVDQKGVVPVTTDDLDVKLAEVTANMQKQLQVYADTKIESTAGHDSYINTADKVLTIGSLLLIAIIVFLFLVTTSKTAKESVENAKSDRQTTLRLAETIATSTAVTQETIRTIPTAVATHLRPEFDSLGHKIDKAFYPQQRISSPRNVKTVEPASDRIDGPTD